LEDPSPSWLPDYFDNYGAETFRLGEIEGLRITGVNRESRTSELVVVAQIGDSYVQALSNQNEAALAHFDQVIASLRFVAAQASKPAPPSTPAAGNPDDQKVAFEGISMVYPAWLASGATVQRVPAFVDPSGFTYNDLPEHIRIDLLDSYSSRGSFTGLTSLSVPWVKQPWPDAPEIRPQIYVLPIGDYADVSSLAVERIVRLRMLLSGRPPQAGEELPVLPTFNSAQDLRGHLRTLAFDGGRGLRFIARYSQSAMPVTNPAVFYTFQGLTNDGHYYVSAFFPLYIAHLPDNIAIDDWDAFNVAYAAYLAQIAITLEELAPTEFEPDLTHLDALVASIRVDTWGRYSSYQSPLVTDGSRPLGNR
jgi:hypothetical protein